MNLYELLNALVVALNANTAAHSGTAASAGEKKTSPDDGAKAGAKTTTTTKTKTTAPKGPSREELTTLLTQVKEQFGAPEAKAIIEQLGAKKMAEIPEGKIAEGFALATAKLAGDADEGDDGDDI